MNDRFIATIYNEGEHKIVVLEDKEAECKVEVFAFGALLNSFYVKSKTGKSINIIDGFSSVNDAQRNITNGFKSAKLNPFVCRMKNGEFAFEEKRYKVEKFYLKDEAIHGLIYDAVYDIADITFNENEASANLKYSYKKDDAGFPFDFDITIMYHLAAGYTLSITTLIQPGNNAMPLSDGWHPYFTFRNTVDDAEFIINSNKMMEFDPSLLPTGKLNDEVRFQQPEKIGTIQLDNCFLLNNNNEPSCILKDEEAGLQLEVRAGAAYPYLQLYIPPHRTAIAIENLSSPPDAFNNKMHLITAQPFSEQVFTTTYIVTQV